MNAFPNLNDTEKQLITRLKTIVTKHSLRDVYLVGGSVRDLLLGGHPHDFDISCPKEITHLMLNQTEKAFYRVYSEDAERQLLEFEQTLKPLLIEEAPSRGVQVLSVKLRQLADSKDAKKESYKLDFRELTSNTVKDDALSRDFTINAIFYDLAKDQFVDIFGVGLLGSEGSRESHLAHSE